MTKEYMTALNYIPDCDHNAIVENLCGPAEVSGAIVSGDNVSPSDKRAISPTTLDGCVNAWRLLLSAISSREPRLLSTPDINNRLTTQTIA